MRHRLASLVLLCACGGARATVAEPDQAPAVGEEAAPRPLTATLEGVAADPEPTVILSVGQDGTFSFSYRSGSANVYLPMPAPVSLSVPDVHVEDGEFRDTTGRNWSSSSSFDVSMDLESALPACESYSADGELAGDVSGSITLRITNSESGNVSSIEGDFVAQVYCSETAAM